MDKEKRERTTGEDGVLPWWCSAVNRELVCAAPFLLLLLLLLIHLFLVLLKADWVDRWVAEQTATDSLSIPLISPPLCSIPFHFSLILIINATVLMLACVCQTRDKSLKVRLHVGKHQNEITYFRAGLNQFWHCALLQCPGWQLLCYKQSHLQIFLFFLYTIQGEVLKWLAE